MVLAQTSVGVPETVPVLLLNTTPGGRKVGEILHSVIVPGPLTVADIVVKVPFTQTH